MEFDRFTVTLLVLRDDAPDLTDGEAAELQDAHMAHLAELADAGFLLAAGPLHDERYRGLSVLNVPVEKALELKNADPSIRAGVYSIVAMSWMTPGGALRFGPARFPRSMAEAAGD